MAERGTSNSLIRVDRGGVVQSLPRLGPLRTHEADQEPGQPDHKMLGSGQVFGAGLRQLAGPRKMWGAAEVDRMGLIRPSPPNPLRLWEPVAPSNRDRVWTLDSTEPGLLKAVMIGTLPFLAAISRAGTLAKTTGGAVGGEGTTAARRQRQRTSSSTSTRRSWRALLDTIECRDAILTPDSTEPGGRRNRQPAVPGRQAADRRSRRRSARGALEPEFKRPWRRAGSPLRWCCRSGTKRAHAYRQPEAHRWRTRPPRAASPLAGRQRCGTPTSHRSPQRPPLQ